MNQDLAQLLDSSEALLELARLKDSLVNLVETTSEKELSIARKRFNGKIVTTSFRVYDSIIDEFRLFAQCFPEIKNQDLFSQALLEFMDRYSHKWHYPLVLEVGTDLVKLVDRDTNGKIIQYIETLREEFASHDGKSFPPVKVKDCQELAKNEYRIVVDGTERTRGKVTRSTRRLESQLRTVFTEKGA